ncbi:hypothetical protein PUN28_011120 [Cardiocondyla obscurior]|uniref:Uncharacterized protein n=1 Tax=Cardiocondyla obscurior TaxID=286306 RepID=A0AAW2FNS8_9HYME
MHAAKVTVLYRIQNIFHFIRRGINRTVTFFFLFFFTKSPTHPLQRASLFPRTPPSTKTTPSKHRLYWFAFSAMISGVITMVVLICYCCHKNVRKHRPQEYSQYWRAEPDIHSLEVFTMDTHCIERSAASQAYQEEGVPASLPACPVTSGPPPAYESLIFDPRALPSPTDKKDESDDPNSIISPPISSLPTESEANRINKREDIPRDDQGLPSYEAALKLEADGYV